MKRVMMIALGLVTAMAAGCASDEGAKKEQQETAEAADTREEDKAAAEEAAAEEEAPAEEAPAEEAEPEADLSAFVDAGKITAGETAAGAKGMKVSSVKAEGGFATCGLQDGDVVTHVNGAAIAAGKEGADSLKKACATKGTLTVDRGGEAVKLGGE